MTFHLKNTFSSLALGTALSATALIAGCGGGGGSSPSPTATPAPPSPFDATYNAAFTSSGQIPTDGKPPSGSLTISGGRASLQTTFYLQPSVVSAVQAAIDQGLRDNNVGSEIPKNQVPADISFTASGQLDGSGKVVLTSKQTVSICGTATLTVDPTFTSNGTTSGGTGTYQITFPNNLVAKVRGQSVEIFRDRNGNPLTCNNLPLRTGTVAFTR